MAVYISLLGVYESGDTLGTFTNDHGNSNKNVNKT